MKKILCAFLCVAMCFSLLAGCSSGSTSSTEDTTSTETTTEVATANTDTAAAEESDNLESESSDSATATVEPEVNQEESSTAAEDTATSSAVTYPLYEEPVSFTWLDIVNVDYNQGVVTEDLAENEVYAYISELTGIYVDWDLRTDASTVYPLIIAAGDYPDCWGSKLSDCYSNFETAYEEEVIIDLTDLIDEYMPNYSALLESSEKLYSSSFSENGYRLAICAVQTGYTQFGAQVRGDILEELNLDEPETYDDFYNMLLAMKDAYPDSTPLILSKSGSMNCSWLGGGLGVNTNVGWSPMITLNLYQVDGTVKLGLLEEEYREYITMIAQWYAEGLIDPDFYTNDGMGPPQDGIAANETFVWYGSVNEIPTLTEILPDEDAYIIGMADVTREAGEIIHTGEDLSKSLNSSGYAISTDCEHPEYVLQYFDYLYSDEGYMLANYGFEGQTYELDADGNPQYTDFILNNDTYTYVSALFKYCIYEGPFELDVNRYFVSFDDAQTEAVEKWESNRDAAYNLPSDLAFTADESSRVSTLTNEIGTYCSEMILKFILGNADIDANWEAFIENLYTLGAEELIEIEQAALDRYNS